jgi:hypothetical protein
MSRFCCDCHFLNISEEDQNKSDKGKVPNICEKYMTNLYHLEFHPNILKCDACIKDAKRVKYKCYFDFLGKELMIESENGINEFSKGFWLNEDFKFTKVSDCFVLDTTK